MKNFTYNSTAKVIFGKDQINTLKSELVKHQVKNLLLVYGKASIKKLGIYDKIYSITNELGIDVFEESNVRPNPDISSVKSGISTCLENNVDFILAAGGGSVIDCAKAIGFGSYFDGDIWDVYIRKADAVKSIPLGVVITLAATGTETNGNSVISNDLTNEKRSVAYPFSVPKFAIIDPTYTLSVNNHHTYAGSIDIIMHILEQYFSNDNYTDTSDYMSTGVIKSIIENTNKIKAGQDSYEVRANISWGSTIGLNWILGVDKVGDWATHRLSYPLTKEFDITHGYALAMIFSSWLKVALKYNPKTMNRRLTRLGEEIFNISEPSNVIDEIDKLFTSWGADVTICKYELTNEQINQLINNALALGPVGKVISIDKDKALEIFMTAKERNNGI